MSYAYAPSMSCHVNEAALSVVPISAARMTWLTLNHLVLALPGIAKSLSLAHCCLRAKAVTAAKASCTRLRGTPRSGASACSLMQPQAAPIIHCSLWGCLLVLEAGAAAMALSVVHLLLLESLVRVGHARNLRQPLPLRLQGQKLRPGLLTMALMDSEGTVNLRLACIHESHPRALQNQHGVQVTVTGGSL